MNNSDSMSSFEQVDLAAAAETPESPGDKPSTPSEQPAEPTAQPAAAQRPPAVAETSTAAAAAAPAAAAPAAAKAAAAAPAGATPTAQAAAALQSVLGFLGAATDQQDSEAEEEEEQEEEGEGEKVDDEPEPPLEDPVAKFEKEAIDAALQAEAAVKEVRGVRVHGRRWRAGSSGREGAGTGLPRPNPLHARLLLQVGLQLLHGAAEAKESLSSLAHGLTSWWSTLDPGADQAAAAAPAPGGQRGQDVQQAAEALGLDGGETVLESFACQLLQTYTCSSNFFTPVRQASKPPPGRCLHAHKCWLQLGPRRWPPHRLSDLPCVPASSCLQIAFPGSLHVTSQRLLFAFEEKGVAPIKLPGKAIKSVAKHAADAQKGGWVPDRRVLARAAALQQMRCLARWLPPGLTRLGLSSLPGPPGACRAA